MQPSYFKFHLNLKSIFYNFNAQIFMKKFNKLILITLISSIVLNSSCDNDDETDVSPTGLIVGSWVLSSVSATISGISVSGNASEFIEPECSVDDILQFNADNTISVSEGAEVCPNGETGLINAGTWSISGDQLTMTSGGETLSFPFSIEGNTMTWDFSGLESLDLGEGDTFIFTLTRQ